MQNTCPVIILELFLGGLQIGRILGKRGIPVFGIDRKEDAIGAHSRYITRLDAPTDRLELCNYLIEFSKKAGKKPVLIATSDYYVRFMYDYYQELSEHFCFPFPDRDTIEKLVRKTGTAEIFADNDIPHPGTMRIDKGSCSISKDISNIFPCILKPDLQDRWTCSQKIAEYVGPARRCLFVSSQEELDLALKAVGNIDNMVLQEFIPGNDLYYFVGYRNKKGRILASCVGKKIRTFPNGLGSETLLESEHIPELLDTGNGILHALNYIGPAGIDFKFDPRDGKYKVIEINCRLGINDGYLSKYGVDIPYIYYRDSQDIEVAPCVDYPDGITWYNFAADLDWMRVFCSNRSAWVKWFIHIIRGYDTYAIYSLHDPAPFIKSATELLLRIPKKIKKTVKAKIARMRNDL